jgi:sugar lactone lactonase YvrE
MVQGENTLSVKAIDPVVNTSAPKLVKVKVDHTAPELGLSGNLTEQASVGTNLHEYTLNYTAKDGDDATAAAASPIGTAGSAPGQLEVPTGIDVDANGNTWVADMTNNRVVEYDKNGAFVRQIGGPAASSATGQFNGPRGVSVAPNGDIWVADYGNKRLQEFYPSGSFRRSVTLNATEKLEGPYALDVAQDGSVWVSDVVTHRIRHFSATGAFLGNAPGSTLASVGGLAIDSYGNIWQPSTSQTRSTSSTPVACSNSVLAA